MSYNGWTNHATWNIALWLQNDESIYRMAIARARRFELPISAGDARHICEHAFQGAIGRLSTPDGTKLSDQEISWTELASCISEMIS